MNNEQKNNIADLTTLASRFINNTNKNIFLTGKAGTGKTTLLKHIIKHTYKNTIVAAPTGIAAINAGGVTIHSLFQLPFGAFIPDRNASVNFTENSKINTPQSLFKQLQLNSNKRKLLQEMELLIIDEVSMLRADLLDAIDTVLRGVRRKNQLPFGGIQVLFIGDLLQLPPVVKEDEWQYLKQYYASPFFFEAHVLRQHKPLYIELEKVYRQQDDTFIRILNDLRTNQVSNEDIQVLNNYYRKDVKTGLNETYIHLTTHNHKADSINKESLQNINNPSFFFKAEISGDFNEYAYPVEQNLELKKDAQIMFIKNDPTGAQRFFNGKIGTISSINENKIEVQFDDNSKPISIEKYEWQNIKYSLNETTNEVEEKIAGTFTQYPVKLAWAITVHKSQGLTFQKAIIDIESAFAPGQVYVALSRLTSLEGLILSSPINIASLSTDNNIVNFSTTKDKQEELSMILETESLQFFRSYITGSFNFSELLFKFTQHIESYQKDEQRSVKQKHFSWAFELKKELEATKTIADKFITQLHSIFENSSGNYTEQLLQRVTAAKEHFSPLLKKYSKVLLKQIEDLKNEKKVKAYLSELVELDAALFKQLQTIDKALAMVNSVNQKIELTKDSVHSHSQNLEREKEISNLELAPKRKKKTKEEKEEKKAEKPDTKRISFDLFKSGKTIEEIASERSMAYSTIESHLAYYVSLGLLDVKQFVDDEKLKNIITVSNTLDTTLFAPIKNALGDEYSYAEIKFAMAYYQNSKK